MRWRLAVYADATPATCAVELELSGDEIAPGVYRFTLDTTQPLPLTYPAAGTGCVTVTPVPMRTQFPDGGARQ